MKSKIISAIVGSLMGLAARFNMNVTHGHVQAAGPALAYIPSLRRSKGFTTGIKGIASTNNTQYGAGLREHFRQERLKARKNHQQVGSQAVAALAQRVEQVAA